MLVLPASLYSFNELTIHAEDLVILMVFWFQRPSVNSTFPYFFTFLSTVVPYVIEGQGANI